VARCFVLTNVVLVAIVVALAQGVTVRSMLDDYVRHAGLAFAIMAFIAALATALWRSLRRSSCCWPAALCARAVSALRLSHGGRDDGRETDGLTGLRNHRAFQDDLAA